MKTILKIFDRFTVDLIMLALVIAAFIQVMRGRCQWGGMLFLVIGYIVCNIINKWKIVGIVNKLIEIMPEVNEDLRKRLNEILKRF